MVVMAASADLIIPNNRQFICYQVFDNGPYLWPSKPPVSTDGMAILPFFI
jgi:hypothetical protein